MSKRAIRTHVKQSESRLATDESSPRRPSEEVIRDLAYKLWDQAGRPEGDGAQFWLEAERTFVNPR